MENKIIFKDPDFFNLRFKIYVNVRIMFLVLINVLFSLFAGGAIVLPFGEDARILILFATFVSLMIYLLISIWAFPFFMANNLIDKHFKVTDSGMILEVVYNPRKIRGIEGFLDSGDDVGVVKIENDSLIFNGDSSDFIIHKDLIDIIKFKNIGVRVLWLFGNNITFKLREPVSGILGFTLYPRVGFTLPQYWRANRKFQESIKSMGFKVTN